MPKASHPHTETEADGGAPFDRRNVDPATLTRRTVELRASERRADNVFESPDAIVVQIEFEYGNQPRMNFRMLDYGSRLVCADRPTGPIRELVQIVIQLTGPPMPTRIQVGRLRNEFRLVHTPSMAPTEFLASPPLLPFALVNGGASMVAEVITGIAAIVDPELRRVLVALSIQLAPRHEPGRARRHELSLTSSTSSGSNATLGGVEPGTDPAETAETAGLWIVRIYRHSLTRFLGFAALGFAIDLTLLTLLNYFTSLPLWATVSIAFWITYAINFVLNRYFAFNAAHRDLSGQLTRYIPQVLVDYGLTVFGVELYTYLGAGVIVARIIAGATNAIFNYVVYRWWTFGRSEPDSASDPGVKSP